MARRSSSPWRARAANPGSAGGATMFVMPATTDGIDVIRHVGTVDRSMLGGHCEMGFRDAFVPDEHVLGGVDEGFRYAQVRLGPARMTHVMRWTGAVRRAHEVAVRHVASATRIRGPTFRPGHDAAADRRQRDRPGGHPGAAATGLQRARRRRPGSQATSIAKTFAAEALHRVADRAVQMCGGLGVSTRPARRQDRPRDASVPDLRRPVGGAPLVNRQAGGTRHHRRDAVTTSLTERELLGVAAGMAAAGVRLSGPLTCH